MDINHKPETQSAKKECSEEQIKDAKEVIRSAIRETNGAFLHEIMDKNQQTIQLPRDCIIEALRSMRKDREIRQKEDELEHDWEYRFTKP